MESRLDISRVPGTCKHIINHFPLLWLKPLNEGAEFGTARI